MYGFRSVDKGEHRVGTTWTQHGIQHHAIGQHFDIENLVNLVVQCPEHTETVIIAMTGCAIVLAVVPVKLIIMGVVVSVFASTSKLGKEVKRRKRDMGNRRLKGWWDSIPVIPIEVVDKVEEIPKAMKRD
ncbi:hypothetical protein OSB04_013677 [Centaurea solstitialis]|uniref:Uncharacterized protein n=1 Tax=Centaurea solstitialis TaxID=347529 RepID=A0AA38TDQ9_9ASTR|nr:hypothetical protein OSB04_013677 [Centaurea solstitialis]